MAPTSEAKKRANAKWAAANMQMLGCKTRKDKAAVFKAECEKAGTTMNKIFTEAMDNVLRDRGIDPDSFSRK